MTQAPASVHRTRDEEGASAVEYGLLVAGIAAVVFIAIFAFGDMVLDVMGDSCGSLTAVITQNPSC